jgi:antagonist of KipI
VRELRHLPAAPARDSITRLRVMRGPAENPAADRALADLLSASFRISPRSDRMGYRLEGGTIAADTGASIVTAPTVMGLVQVPPAGDPILLMADRQTTGGYSAIAVVIDADLAVAGQLGPGHAVSFDACSHDAACLALKEREARLIDLQAAPR